MKNTALILLAFTSLLVLACQSEPKQKVGEAAPKAENSEPVKDISGEEAVALLSAENRPTVIDIRTPEEFAEGHIEGAQLIDYKANDFEEKVAKLDRDKAYLFHCKSGGRSKQSLGTWEELGFQKLYHLDSGFLGWEKAGGEVKTGE